MNIPGLSANDARRFSNGAASAGQADSNPAHQRREIDSATLLGSRGASLQQTKADGVQRQPRATQLSMRYDKESAKYVVKLVEVETGEVIREYPPEEIRRIAAEINRYLGTLFDKQT